MEQTPLDALNCAIQKFGGMSALARAMKLPSFRIIQAWRRTRVPAEHCPHVEELTAVRCEDLRPDVRWYVLRAKPRSTRKAVKGVAKSGGL